MNYETLGVEGNMGLVHMVADSKYRTLCLSEIMEYQDLVSEGVLGLIYALERFDPDRGTRFSSYAVKCIGFFMLRGHQNLFKEVWKARTAGVSCYTISLHQKDDIALISGANDRGVNAGQMLDDVNRKLIWERLRGQLSPTQRKVTDLLRQGMAQSEIAKRLGVTRQAVNQACMFTVQRAREYFLKEAA